MVNYEKMFKKIMVFILVFLFWPAWTWAFCPVCTVAAGAGVGLARWLKIDDTITGSWIGALLVSVSIWTINWLERKKWNFRYYKIITLVFYYGLVIVPFHYSQIIWHQFNTLGGIDKLLLGIFSGSLVFYFGGKLYENMKKKNGGRAHFPFQKVVMPAVAVMILSGVFYFLTRG